MGRKVPKSENPEDRELFLQKYRIIYRFNEEKKYSFNQDDNSWK